MAPHKVNYRAIVWSLKSLGVQYAVATNAVGSCNPNFRVGDFVLVDQFIDFTKSRPATFFDGEGTPVVHTDVTNPYCPALRQALLSQGLQMGVPIHRHRCYVCLKDRAMRQPPRYGWRQPGGDVLGMTGVPEVVLAREAGICYASVCIVTNMGAGMSETALSHIDVSQVVKERMGYVRRLAVDALVSSALAMCRCGESSAALPGLQEA